MIFLLGYFIFLLIIVLKGRSISILFLLLLIFSLLGTFFIGIDYPIKNFFTVFNIFSICILTSLIILPWRTISNFTTIEVINQNKIRKLTYFLLIINLFVFLIFSVTTYFVVTLVENVNEFKYAEGVSVDFYYSLPYSTKPIILANYLYPLSYFLIPLHLYYLSQKKYKLSIICFIFSLNSILYGMTFFSRSVYVHYVLIYVGMFWITFNTFPRKTKKIIRRILGIFTILIVIVFISVTVSRFEKDTLYANAIPSNSPIQDPSLYSIFDYLSQSNYNSLYVLDSYELKTFNGQITLQPLLALLANYKIINYDTSKYTSLRQQMWPKHWYMFLGFAAYTIFDFGYIFAFLFSILYYYIIQKQRPKFGIISINNLFVLVLLIQLPLMAIFYSTLATILFSCFYLIPILCYLHFTIKWNNVRILSSSNMHDKNPL